MSQDRQFCTFQVGELYMGIEVLNVHEVIRSQEMTPVPLAAPAVSGLINLRGEIVTAIDLRRRLRLAPRPEGHQPVNVVIRTSDGAVSLLVDEIGDVIEPSTESFEPISETVDKAAQGLISGVYKLTDRLLLVLDVDRAIDLDSSAEPG
ncbi:MAG: chemotaxis protein CheW [Gemmatimonadales bacterium]